MTGPANDTRTLAPPAVNPETQAFWDAAAEGRLLLKHCLACGETHYYPRSLCPFCFSDRTEWREAAGTGEIYTVSVMRRGAGAPYAVAYVTLDEGPRMLTNLRGDLDAFRIGDRVRVSFEATDGGPTVPMFRAAG
ncbi:Zn-ribbon domain-containing OB-fold protein [Sphingomonas aracearum]|uniref:DNA-binding protein n=1 Tax=Sphingomonas aracearum TaxID=2283317 RepID=A0A369VYH7_9SPHN|nr:OB-fold domain-containing protein [Sphingomonas aracearum]RDE04881.1 DNA-binding protein [Sphingomonas aracearum]